MNTTLRYPVTPIAARLVVVRLIPDWFHVLSEEILSIVAKQAVLEEFMHPVIPIK
jgi:hypothetical protein